MIAIEKGVPLPPVKTRQPKYPLAAMQVGDSFLLPPDMTGTKANIYSKASALGMKVTLRATPEGLRVWRVQ